VTRRANGDGTIYERSRGVWHVKIPIGIDGATGKLIRKSQVVRGSRRDAEKVARRMVLEHEQSGRLTPTRGTVGELLERWHAHTETTLADSTRDQHRIVINVHLPPLSEIRCSDLRVMDIDALYLSLTKGGMKADRLRKVHQVLSLALAQGVTWKLLTVNPARDASPPKQTRRKPTPAPPDKVTAILAEASPEQRLMFRTVSATGLRRGEVVGLKWTDIDLTTGHVSIARSMRKVRGVEQKERQTKSARGVRRVKLTPELTADLAECRKAQLAAFMVNRPADQGPGAWVFSPDKRGLVAYSLAWVTHSWAAACERAGVTGVRLQDVRGMAATEMHRAGVPMAHAAAALGHSVQVHTDHYIGVDHADSDRAFDALHERQRKA
jgi:integrase